MNYRAVSSLLALLFLFMMTMGSLQAKTVFTCAMMDTDIFHECCCDGNRADRDCVDHNCNVMLGPNKGTCCDKSIEISIIADEAKQSTSFVKSTEIRSDVDPPETISVNFLNIPTPPSSVVILLVNSQPIGSSSGSSTYLVTQRLRI
jgi:hypothetical protein